MLYGRHKLDPTDGNVVGITIYSFSTHTRTQGGKENEGSEREAGKMRQMERNRELPKTCVPGRNKKEG